MSDEEGLAALAAIRKRMKNKPVLESLKEQYEEALSSFYEDCEVSYIRDHYNVKYSKDKKRLIEIPKAMSFVSVKDGTEIIMGHNDQSEKLVSVKLPSSVRIIGEDVFSYSSLRYLFGMEGLQYIGAEAFVCSHVRDIILPEGLLYIGDNAFGDSMLQSIYLPTSLIEIGKDIVDTDDLKYIFVAKGYREKYNSMLGNHCGKIIELGGIDDWEEDEKRREHEREYWEERRRLANDASNWYDDMRDLERDNWYAMTDGMYGDYPDEGYDWDYESIGVD